MSHILPSNMTSRYLTNLLHNGTNKNFEIEVIIRDRSMIEDICVGVFYRITVKRPSETTINKLVGIGPTPVCALRHALSKFGVTFSS